MKNKKIKHYRVVALYDIESVNPFQRNSTKTLNLEIKSLDGLKEYSFNQDAYAQITLHQHLYCKEYWFGEISFSQAFWLNSIPVVYSRKFEDLGYKNIRFYMMDKLQYADDVRNKLIAEKINPDSFKPNLFQKLRPMIITKTSADGDIQWRNLNRNDVVVDRNFKQFWPKKTGKYPKTFINLFEHKAR